jgi:hypothetical protein
MAPEFFGNAAGAFAVLLQEIEAEVCLANKAGAQAFEKRDYEQARQALERAGKLAELRSKVMALRLDWEETLGFPVDASEDEGQDADALNSVEAFRAACLARVEKRLAIKLIRKRATTYVTADGERALICAVSREYTDTTPPRYWFAFHTNQDQLLASVPHGYLALGCGTPEQLLLIPFARFRPWLESLNTTARNDGVYWHIHVLRQGDRLKLDRKKGFDDVDLTEFLLSTHKGG